MDARALAVFSIVWSVLAVACGEAEEKPSAIESSTATESSRAEIVVDLCPSWEVGEERHYEFVERKERRGIQSEGKSRVQITVTETSESGYLFEWKADSPEVEVSGIKLDDIQNPDLEQFLALAEDLSYQVETDECGLYSGVRNWREIGDKFSEVFDLLAPELGKRPGTDALSLERYFEEMKLQFGRRETIETMVGEDVALLFGLYGDSYSTLESLTYDYEIPNPFGGRPFPAVGDIALRDFERDSGCGVILETTSYDEAEFRGVLVETFQDLAERLGQPTPSESDFDWGAFSIEDNYRYEFCKDLGWLKAARSERVIRSPEGSASEFKEFTDITE